MRPLRRWAAVAALALIVVAVPYAPRLVPVSDPEVSAATLLKAVQGSADAPYSGSVETSGRVQLAVGDRFADLSELFGDASRLRVWWADAGAWRVDRLLLSGEDDLVHAGDTTASYDYEAARAVLTRDPEIRLPRTVDVVPPSLARIAFTGASPEEVARIPARRVAGMVAPGIRFSPVSDRTTIDHVDAWVDAASGLALRVEVFSRGAGAADFTTAFGDFASGRPPAERVSLSLSRQVETDVEDAFDLVDAANRYAPFRLPRRVAGLARTSGGDGAVGVYGLGVERFIVLPLREREAEVLRTALRQSPGAVVGALSDTQRRITAVAGTRAAVGPLGILVTGEHDFGWLVAGTVTPETLEAAALDVDARARYVEARR